MSNDPRFDRRAFLRASGAVAVGAAVAGCTDTGGDTQEPADGGNDTEATQGPPTDLPPQVPGRVGDIHDTIDSFLNDDIDHLGDALGDLLGDDGE